MAVLRLFCISAFVLITSFVLYIYFSLPRNRIVQYHSNYNKVAVDARSRRETYDFIIIGGGSAGSVLANRLSKNSKVTVLLIEAGGYDNSLMYRIPLLHPMFFNSESDWAYNTIPQEKKGNQTVYLPRGKVLGGCSSINGMIYLRGSAYDYEEWNMEGWDYDSILKYFKKSEKQMRKNISTDFHGTEGEWVVSDQEAHRLSHLIVDSFRDELNLDYVDDFNGEKYQREGVGINQVNILDGERHSLADAFLSKEVLRRKNLYIKLNTHVNRVIIYKNTAIGVEAADEKGKVYEIFANREVILSAGTYNSPQLLQLSGIGDQRLLDSHGIKTMVTNPEVGSNLQDHIGLFFLEKTKEIEGLEWMFNFPYNIYYIGEWLLRRKTPEFKANIGQVNGFFRTSVAKENNETAPDVQLIAGPLLFINKEREKYYNNTGATFGLFLMNHKSRGTLSIKSSNPRDAPVIDKRIFSDSDDYKRIREMFDIMSKVRKTPAFEKVSDGNLYLDHIDNMAEEEIEKYILDHAFLMYHGCCTNAMGKVVDKHLKVYGVNQLRVIDASVMPVITRANINAPTVMIAEKGADMILEDHGLLDSLFNVKNNKK